MVNGISALTQGIQATLNTHSQRADRMSAGIENPKVVEDMVGISTGKAAFAIQVQALKAYDEMMGNLVDILA